MRSRENTGAYVLTSTSGSVLEETRAAVQSHSNHSSS